MFFYKFKLIYKIFLILLFTSFKIYSADLIIFSYDRPMQLYALLESIEKYVKNLTSTSVIYRTTNDTFDSGYKIIKDKFSKIKFYKQDNDAKDFKKLLLQATFQDSSSEYFLYGVDDLIVTDFIDINYCIEQLEKEKALGFFLRLGKNITENYTIIQNCKQPVLKKCKEDIFSWKFVDGSGDWGLPASTDMTIYRKFDFKDFFYNLNYSNPNDFEAFWLSVSDKNKIGLCFEFSKNLNIPLIIVQKEKWHRNMNLCTTQDLLDLFLNGFKIDITNFEKFRNSAPHVELLPEFVKI
ncbi:hypothetical protein K9L05_03320 [Candidatus Babeliales bacterium]|nr:hypothetical protein [Candidatus Babeliales bacterium]